MKGISILVTGLYKEKYQQKGGDEPSSLREKKLLEGYLKKYLAKRE